MWVPTRWLKEKRIPSKLRNKPCDRHCCLMISQKLGLAWAKQDSIPDTFRDFIRACQSGTMDVSQLYSGVCVRCQKTITNLVVHHCGRP
jgi:hypothetical protein